MTKSEVKNLEKRVRGLGHGSSPTDDAESDRMAWLVFHMTEEEKSEACTCIRRLETDQGDKEAEERMRGLFEKARVRGEARPVSVKEEFLQQSTRIEELRNMGHALTDAEHDELQALIAWFAKFRQEPT